MSSRSANPIHRRWKPARLAPLLIVAGLVLMAGCDDDDSPEFVDVTPPAIPNGVFSITGDQAVFLTWNPNREDDLAGYRVWVNEDLSETFDELAVLAPFEEGVYQDNGTPEDVSDDFLRFEDFPLVNGVFYSYAVSAFDDAGNESDLSFELVIDVPRPEGEAVVFFRDADATRAGFDFSDGVSQGQAFDDASTDVYFERDGQGVPFLVVPNDRVRVQDFGFVGFDVASFAPATGYSATGRVEAIPGHTYIFRIAQGPGDFGADDNYAKFEILDMTADDAGIFWGYQEVDGERELRPAGDRPDTDGVPTEGGAR